ncbi:hypothetical protein [Bradyrhizobium erythrophlei]|uniref:hypothetical protein n=1 Tax=Bradyrhizobium erythrophlei TaxID=1437360 RepID=UPI0015C57CCD|nr:hypothetical protein [Bradyrhizobium erythrophlei]
MCDTFRIFSAVKFLLIKIFIAKAAPSLGQGRRIMDQRDIALMRTHERNIERYRALLLTTLTDVETRFIERRLSEEYFAIEIISLIGRQSSAAP